LHQYTQSTLLTHCLQWWCISDVLLLLLFVERLELKELHKQYDKSEDDLKSLQSVGQMIGEVLRQLDDERCMLRNSCRK
jgi:ATP-dependent 26S proteasome regulatory subunit